MGTVLGQDGVTWLRGLEPCEHQVGQLEIERELDMWRRLSTIKAERSTTPQEEVGDPVAPLIANRSEDVHGTDEPHGDERVAHATAVARKDSEREIELFAFELATTHQV